jgi:hypothetical protein
VEIFLAFLDPRVGGSLQHGQGLSRFLFPVLVPGTLHSFCRPHRPEFFNLIFSHLVISVESGANRSQLPVRCALLLLAGSLCLISSSVQEKVLTFGYVAAPFHGAVHQFRFLIACRLLQEEAGLVLRYRIKKLEVF